MEAHHQRRARPRELYLLPALGPGVRCQPESIGKSWPSGCLQWKSSNDGVNPVPKSLTEKKFHEWINDYVHAARNAITAGFDGVEIHGANGYLCDQFLQDNCNNRDDDWGGNFENRFRFGLEVAKAVCKAVGPQRTRYRISPWSSFQGMRMKELHAQFSDLVQKLSDLSLAYLHVVEPRISGGTTVEAAEEDNTFLFDAFGDTGAMILVGGFTAQSAEKAIQVHPGHRVAIAFGRRFLANPDLPLRITRGLALNEYQRATFYTPRTPVGYIDYPFYPELTQQ